MDLYYCVLSDYHLSGTQDAYLGTSLVLYMHLWPDDDVCYVETVINSDESKSPNIGLLKNSLKRKALQSSKQIMKIDIEHFEK